LRREAEVAPESTKNEGEQGRLFRRASGVIVKSEFINFQRYWNIKYIFETLLLAD